MKNLEILKELNSKGIYVIDSYLSSDVLKKLNTEFDEFTSKEHIGAPLTPYSKGKCARIVRDKFNKSQFPTTTSVFYSDEFKTLSEEYLKSEISLNNEIFEVKEVIKSMTINE